MNNDYNYSAEPTSKPKFNTGDICVITLDNIPVNKRNEQYWKNIETRTAGKEYIIGESYWDGWWWLYYPSNDEGYIPEYLLKKR